MKPLLQFEWRCVLDFLDELRALKIPPDNWPKVERALVRLRYVKSAWIDHTCCIELEFRTRRAVVAEQRLAIVRAKVWRTLKRYAS